MKAPVPLQFLIGLTRLVAVFFGLRSLETFSTAILRYWMQSAMSPEMARAMPSTWSFYGLTLLVYLAIVLGVWFAAPFICRVSWKSASNDQPEECTGSGWNEVAIFLIGTLVVGWGINRLADAIVPILKANTQQIHHELTMADELGFFVTAVLIGFGALMMSRFANINGWIQRRKERSNAGS